MSLYLKVLEGETKQTLENDQRLFPAETYLPNLDDNIKFGNSLIDPSTLRQIPHSDQEQEIVNPFSWTEAFPKIKGRFDAVIGNPPYLNIDDTWGAGEVRLKCIKQAYGEVYNDKTDILYYFLHKAVQLSKHHVGFIVSRAFLEAFKADKLRGWLAKHSTIDELIDFRDRHIFEGVGITTAILHLEKRKAKSQAQVYQLVEQTAELSPLDIRLQDRLAFSEFLVEQSKFTSAPWIFAGEDAQKIIAKIDAAGEALGSILTIGQGMQTGRNSVFGKLTKSEVDAWNLCPEDYRYRARNSDIQRYEIINSGEVLLYLENYSSFRELPKPVQAHLKRHEKELKDRAAYKRGDCKWWQYAWPLHKNFYSRRRLYSPFLSDTNRFGLDTKKQFLGLTDTTVLFEGDQDEQLEYFQALLNSRLLSWRFRYNAKLKGAGIYEYFWNNLSKLKVLRAKPGTQCHDNLVGLVSEITNMSRLLRAARSDADNARLSGQISAADREIDLLVYGAYGLTQAEIAAVEKALESAVLRPGRRGSQR